MYKEGGMTRGMRTTLRHFLILFTGLRLLMVGDGKYVGQGYLKTKKGKLFGFSLFF
jgi:hypothetical protein